MDLTVTERNDDDGIGKTCVWQAFVGKVAGDLVVEVISHCQQPRLPPDFLPDGIGEGFDDGLEAEGFFAILVFPIKLR